MENSLFKGLNLSDARSENETREEYKLRKKRNNKFLELYDRLGREQFQQMFPEGITYEMFDEDYKKTSNEKLGEAK